MSTGEPFDVARAPRPLLDAYATGRLDGLLEGEHVGFQRGWRACDDDVTSVLERPRSVEASERERLTAMIAVPGDGVRPAR